MSEADKSKIIIHNMCDIDDFTAISFVRAVISEGKISKTNKYGKQYCFLTKFKSGIIVTTAKRNDTHTFVITREA